LFEDFLLGADPSAEHDETGGRAGDVHGFAFRHALPRQTLSLGIGDGVLSLSSVALA
jgi:hypothetical protein